MIEVAKRRYMVVPDEDCWTISYQGHKAGRFDSQDEALDEAVKLAREAEGLGYDSQVLVQSEEGRVREEPTARDRRH
ncbi:MAG TPA: DUF2188 domain-containing protein [Caulobacteraceae bacterium]|nr:DUF2188 domain-containing protein [Caulobacteraceae bacterium]